MARRTFAFAVLVTGVAAVAGFAGGAEALLAATPLLVLLALLGTDRYVGVDSIERLRRRKRSGVRVRAVRTAPPTAPTMVVVQQRLDDARLVLRGPPLMTTV